MMRFIIFLVVLTGLFSVALSQGLDKKQENALNAAVRKLNQIQKDVEGFENNTNRGSSPEVFARAVNRNLDSINGRFETVDEKLAGLPVIAEVAEARARQAAYRMRLDAILAEANQGQAQAAQASGNWDEFQRSEAFQQDKALFDGMFESINSLTSFSFVSRTFNDCGPIRAEEFEHFLGHLQNLDTYEAVLQEKLQFYEQFVAVDRFATYRANELHEQLLNLRQILEGRGSESIQVLEQLIANYDALVAEAYSAQQAAEAKGLYFSLWDFIAHECGSSLAVNVRNIERLGAYISAATPSYATEVNTKVAELSTTYEQLKAQVAAETLANKSAPEDNYSGADAPELKAYATNYFNQLFPNEEVLGVYLQGNWESTERYDWVSSSASWEYINRSSLWGNVVVKYDDQHALERWFYIAVDHQLGDNRKIHAHTDDYSLRQPSIDKLILISNL